VSFGAHWQDWQRLVTVATGCVTVWLLALLVLRLAGAKVAVAAAAIAALYPNLWMNDGLVMSESISMMLVSLALLLALRAAEDRRLRWAAATGAALGFGVLARSELALLVPLVATWLALVGRLPQRHWRSAAVAVAMSGLVVAPWVGFNLARFERPVLLTTNDGTTLLGANCPTTYWGDTIGGWTIECVVADPAFRPDEEPSVRSVRQRGMAVDFVTQHLGSVPKVVAARLGRTLDLYGFEGLVSQDVGEERPRWGVWAGIAAFWVLAPLAAFGATRTARRARMLLLLPVAVVLVTTVLFYGAHRIRSSAEPAMVVLAAVGAMALWHRLRHTVLE
jgi:4-amino-4-deoxy-L-arabinose transferase-like glycosyltransferase